VNITEFRLELGIIDRFPDECYLQMKNVFEITSRKFKRTDKGIVFRSGPLAGFEANELDFEKALGKVDREFGHKENVKRFSIYLNRTIKE
jgi:hypothetical protein